MSQPVTPKQSFIQTMLIVSMLFLGMQLFFNRGTAPVVVGSLDDHFKQVRTASSAQEWDKVQQIVQQSLIPAIDEMEKQNKFGHLEAEGKRLEANTLLADAMYKKGVLAKNTGDVQLAWQGLAGWERKYQSNNIWNETVELAPDKQFPTATSTPKLVNDTIVHDLSARYKDDYVWGLAPGYRILDFLVNLTGRQPGFSYAFAAFLLACAVRAVVWPMFKKQTIFSKQMMQLQPRIKEIDEIFKKKDPSGAYKQSPEYTQKVMGVYGEYGVHPLKGCGPALVQMPLFLFVYQCMLHYRFEFRSGTFLWINEAVSRATNGFVAPNLGSTDVILIIVYGITMIISTLLQPISDPSQIKQQRSIGVTMAVVWTVMMNFYPLPSAFVLYWIFTNILSSSQSLYMARKPVPPLVPVAAPGGGKFPFGFDPAKLMAQAEQSKTANGKAVVETDQPIESTEGLFKKGAKPKPQKPKTEP